MPHSVSTYPCDETIDLTTSNETAGGDSADNEDSRNARESRILRKRKWNGGVEIPSKQPVEASAFL